MRLFTQSGKPSFTAAVVQCKSGDDSRKVLRRAAALPEEGRFLVVYDASTTMQEVERGTGPPKGLTYTLSSLIYVQIYLVILNRLSTSYLLWLTAARPLSSFIPKPK